MSAGSPPDRSRRDTREAILACADDLLRRRGYGGFAYQHIAVQLGIRNAAIHYHFPSKEDLGVALVQRYRTQFHEWIRSLPVELDDWGKLRAYFARYSAQLETGDCSLCPGGVLAAEFAVLPQAMQHEARLLMRDTQRWLADVLEQGRRDGVLRFRGDAIDKAVEVGASLQGGLQIARLNGSPCFAQLLTQLSLDLIGLGDAAARECLP
ncbi:TetR/AcrR family transcriptional regulator [Sinimarinibacterium sp. CAU 1509]|uniref:TetR/AcrR family transcriptional regulator n=1 Tax=Sinimarinibacterium sp. CAU 1509 TaxID=2562283 RepID=UPI0010AB6180|nr:TetR/AcrR family transcriptional regulator [Sinimarinibacterium sp. CAU 1509]TJY60916.1 TetR/AcrR family transcriptional regulator [Sinimarinibacterium sp. CAU 1509]